MNLADLQEDAQPPIKCMDCDSPAMLSRIPSQKSSKWIHRRCWPCALHFFVATDAELAKSALFGVQL